VPVPRTYGRYSIRKCHLPFCRHDTDPKVEASLCELNKHVRALHEVEKSAVRRVLVEERSRYCTFIACLKPVLGEEISLVSELQQLEEVRYRTLQIIVNECFLYRV
jgi:hypothetical protein